MADFDFDGDFTPHYAVIDKSIYDSAEGAYKDDVVTLAFHKGAQDGISNTFSIIPNALGKDTILFNGELDVDAITDCNNMACKEPTLHISFDD